MDFLAPRIRWTSKSWWTSKELDVRQRAAVMLAHYVIGKVAELVWRQVPQVVVTCVEVFPDPVL